METLIFNRAISRLTQFIEKDLALEGFVLAEDPGPQEDSGDLVSSESVLLKALNPSLNLEMRFFLVSGKNQNPDALFIRIQSIQAPGPTLSLATLSSRWGSALQEKEFNGGGKPLLDFIEDYLLTLKKEMGLILEVSRQELERLQLSLPLEADDFQSYFLC